MLLLIQAGCISTISEKQDPLQSNLDAAIQRAVGYLESQQNDKGAWPSETYGLYRDGVALTPHVLRSLTAAGRDNDTTHAGFRFIQPLLPKRERHPDPELGKAVQSPVYFLADTLIALHHIEPHPYRTLQRADSILYSFQVFAKPGELYAQSAGWGYGRTTPEYDLPKDIQWVTSFDHGKAQTRIYPQLSANISATVYALDVLAPQPLDEHYSDTRDGETHFMLAGARQFAARCQNFDTGDEQFDDGGFFFNPADAARNKGGPAGTDKNGFARFHSAGSSTADGLRVLLLCRVPKDDPAFVAARDWLFKHFDPGHNPGTFNEDREVLRDAYYFYYAASVADTFILLGEGPENWSQDLAQTLIDKQQADGSFVNPFTDGKEDDPLIATPFALRAMLACKHDLSD